MAEPKRYEMIWDCPGCDSKGLLGLTHRHCPNCGAAQDPTRRYFPPDDQRIAVEDHPYQGVDRICPACETPNAAKAEFCVNCGSPLDEAKAVKLRAEQAAASGATFGEDSAAAAKKEADAKKAVERAAMAPEVPKPPPSRWKWVLTIGCGGLALLVCLGVIVATFWTREAGVSVTGHSWQRSIAIERYETVTDSSWHDSVPSDARGVTCREEQRSTRKIADGQECHDVRRDNGDGTYSSSQQCSTKYRDEPVYDDKCSYVVDRWRHERDAATSGASVADTPRWAEVTLAAGLGLGSERESGRSEAYTLTFVDDKQRALTCDVDQARWTSIADQSAWTANVGMLTASIDCATLKAK